MIDSKKIVQGMESLQDICNAKSNMAIGKGKIAWAGYANTVEDAIAMIKEQEAEISKISKAYLELVGKASKQPQIVMCKDCWRRDSFDSCLHEGGYPYHDTADNWFCADGERKEGR